MVLSLDHKRETFTNLVAGSGLRECAATEGYEGDAQATGSRAVYITP